MSPTAAVALAERFELRRERERKTAEAAKAERDRISALLRRTRMETHHGRGLELFAAMQDADRTWWAWYRENGGAQ